MKERVSEPHQIGQDLETILNRLDRAAASTTPEERAAHLAESARRLAAFKAREAGELMVGSGAPARHLAAKNLERGGEWGKVEGSLRGRLGSGFLVALTGTRGAGKTQMAVELMKAVAGAGKRPQMLTAMRFFMLIKEGYDREDGQSERQILDTHQRPAMLVIDEIGQRSESEWENRLLNELINNRYNGLKDTLIISNQEANKLEAALGPSITSRMNETGGVICCEWGSYRK